MDICLSLLDCCPVSLTLYLIYENIIPETFEFLLDMGSRVFFLAGQGRQFMEIRFVEIQDFQIGVGHFALHSRETGSQDAHVYEEGLLFAEIEQHFGLLFDQFVRFDGENGHCG